MKMRECAALVLIFGIALSVSRSDAHDGRGGLTLQPEVSTRALSLGETGLTETGQVAGFAMNAACLPLLPSTRVGVSYGELIDGVSASRMSVAAVMPLGASEEYPESGSAAHRFGLGLGLDHRGFELARGSGWATETISVGLGYSLTSYASVGILSKVVFTNSDLDRAGAKGFGFDLGSRAALHPKVDLALVIRNLIASTSWDNGEDETPPLTISLGTSYTLFFGISAEFALSALDDQTKYGMGLDIPVISDFHIRLGYLRHSADYARAIPTGGFGYDSRRFHLAYAFRSDEDEAFGSTHHFSLAVSLD